MSYISDPENIQTILEWPLCIPDYQRAYKWKAKNVLDLISDIEREKNDFTPEKKEQGYRYRIGSVILHKEIKEQEEICNVVDGQQRLLTICLILQALGWTENCALCEQKFDSVVTLGNLRFNLDFIDRHFKYWSQEDKESFTEFLLKRCEMIIIYASDVSEAFQLFDSQNSRGKELDPADLLKAYHLRAMTDEHEKRMCVQRWEEAIDRKVLYPVLSTIIFRCRRWLRKDYSSYDFSKDKIDEFKGINVELFVKEGSLLPFMERLYFMSRLSSFSLDEPIVNGKRFFDYIDHYVSSYELLFPAIGDRRMKKGNPPIRIEDDNDYQDRVRSFCYYSPKMYRTGDGRLRNVLYCLLLAYYDKFGDAHYDEFFDIIYRYVYQLRLDLSRITKSSIRDYALLGLVPKNGQGWSNKVNPFEWISGSYRAFPSELKSLLRLPENISVDELYNKI